MNFRAIFDFEEGPFEETQIRKIKWKKYFEKYLHIYRFLISHNASQIRRQAKTFPSFFCKFDKVFHHKEDGFFFKDTRDISLTWEWMELSQCIIYCNSYVLKTLHTFLSYILAFSLFILLNFLFLLFQFSVFPLCLFSFLDFWLIER